MPEPIRKNPIERKAELFKELRKLEKNHEQIAELRNSIMEHEKTNKILLNKAQNLFNLQNTEAGLTAIELSKGDSNPEDMYIDANQWTEYVETNGGTPITSKINVIDAMNSITTYKAKENNIDKNT